MMKKQSLKYLSLGVAALSLIMTTACETQKKTKILEKDGHYWQRVDTSSAIYLRGPKAQQRLNMHISDCVTGVRELERLGAIQKAFPGKQKDSHAQSELSEFETPDRIGFKRREFLEYHDFESCMFSKGWERVKYLPYDVADRSVDTFTKTHASFQRTHKPTPQERGDYSDLNE